MSKIVVLDGFTATQGDLNWEGLSAFGDVTVYDRTNRSELKQRIADAEIVLTNKVIIDKEAMDAAPKLRYVGVLATGYNIIDLKEAAAREIVVTNVPGYSTGSVAQHVFAFLLYIVSDVHGHQKRIKQGDWERSVDFCFFNSLTEDLAGKKMVIVGKGAIGSEVEKIALVFGLEVLVAQLPGREKKEGRVPLTEALPQADIITLHCPLTENTESLVDRDFLKHCKDGAVLINTARGPLLDEEAVCEALDTGKLKAVCADVLSKEPPADGSRLMNHPNSVITPHIAWGTKQSRIRLIDIVTENVKAFLSGAPKNQVF